VLRWARRADRKRVCVVGLDGVPYSLLTRLMEDGVMPATREVFAAGNLRPMTVTLPEISAVSWPGFMTGQNPGVHGIFGFTDLAPGTYRLRFPAFGDLQAPTIWDRLARTGKRSVVINQPATYPAREMAGVLISGFVAVDLSRAVWPLALAGRLREQGYEVDIDMGRAREDPAFLFGELHRFLAMRERVVEDLWQSEPWDYFEVVITGTDRLHHVLWSAGQDPAHPCHGAFLEYYRRLDEFVARMYERFRAITRQGDPAEGFVVLSDHGFTGIRQEVFLNAWLRGEGYLRFEADEPQSLEQIGSGTRAFALDPSRIYINRKGRFPKGEVAESDVPTLKAEIAERLSALRYEGEPVIERVFDAAELYSGPLAERGPDLVALSRRGFDLKGLPGAKEVFGLRGLQGMHTCDDAFLFTAASGPAEPCITDLAGIILSRLLGQG
jgi:predicted AlkP superfamily phosphohydrolase/phosphomutase